MPATRGVRVEDWRRLYILQHPLAVTLAIGSTIAASVLAAMPQTFAETAVSEAYPPGVRYAWLAVYGIGGFIASVGYWRLAARYEVPGLILQSTAYGTYVLALATQRPAAGLIGLVMASLLCGGMFGRAIVLLTRPEAHPWEQRRS